MRLPAGKAWICDCGFDAIFTIASKIFRILKSEIILNETV
jgi:hypothetical protein